MDQLWMDHIELIVKSMADTAITNEKYFSELDAVVGDADFGVSLADGFRAILKQWDTLDRSSIGTFLMKVGMVITSNVGGCSGPIWGTGFIKAGIVSKGKQSISLLDLANMLRSAIEGIMARGGAQLGDKTLIDAIVPVTNKFAEWSQQKNQDFIGAFVEATEEANKMIESTKDWEAKRGRQSYAGKRSCGTLDPGIVAVAIMMNDITKALKEMVAK